MAEEPQDLETIEIYDAEGLLRFLERVDAAMLQDKDVLEALEESEESYAESKRGFGSNVQPKKVLRGS